MFCPKCGASLKDDYVFCQKCGTKIHLEKDESNKNERIHGCNPGSNVQRTEYDSIEENEISGETEKKQKSIKKILMAAIVIGITLIVVMLIFRSANGNTVSGIYDGVNWIITSDNELIIGNGTDQTFDGKEEKWSINRPTYPWWNTTVKSVRFDGIVHGNGDMSFMFYMCSAESIDLKGFETSQITNMNSMFSRCKANNLDLSGFDTSNVEHMSVMLDSSSIKKIAFGTAFRFVGEDAVLGNNGNRMWMREDGKVGPISSEELEDNYNKNANQWAGIWISVDYDEDKNLSNSGSESSESEVNYETKNEKENASDATVPKECSADFLKENVQRFCGSESPVGKQIGFILPALENDVVVNIAEDVQNSFEKIGCEIYVRYCDGDANCQKEVIENCIAIEKDLIIVWPQESSSLVNVMGQAGDAGIPTIAFIDDIPQSKITTHLIYEENIDQSNNIESIVESLVACSMPILTEGQPVEYVYGFQASTNTSSVEPYTGEVNITFERITDPNGSYNGYSGLEYGIITARDDSGNILWTKQTTNGPLAQVWTCGEIGTCNDMYYYFDNELGIVTLNRYTGDIIWTADARAGNLGTGFGDDGNLYSIGFNSPLYVIAPDGNILHNISLSGYYDCGILTIWGGGVFINGIKEAGPETIFFVDLESGQFTEYLRNGTLSYDESGKLTGNYQPTGRYRVYRTDYLTIRKEPSITAEEIGRLNPGEIVIVNTCQRFGGFINGFAEIEYQDGRGYVLPSYLEYVDGGQIVPSAESDWYAEQDTPVYGWPSESAEVFGVLSNHETYWCVGYNKERDFTLVQCIYGLGYIKGYIDLK